MRLKVRGSMGHCLHADEIHNQKRAGGDPESFLCDPIDLCG